MNQGKPFPKLLIALPIGLAAVVCLLYFYGLTFDPNTLRSRLVGHALPEFTAPALHDRAFMLSSKTIKGPAVLNIWASWCGACQEEHAELMRISQEESVNLYGVAYQDEAEAAIGFLAAQGNPFKWTMFDGGTSLGLPLDVFSLPQTYLIDADGVVKARHIGRLTQEIWVAMQANLK